MYSWEIQNYINLRNSYLNPDEVMEVTDIKKHPQINHIKYNSFDNKYEMWDKEGNYFIFECMPFNDYIIDIIRKEDNMEVNKKESYRLYANRGKGYEYITTKPKLGMLFSSLDELIITNPVNYSTYLIIQNINNGDVPYWLNHNNQEEYLKFKEDYFSSEINQEEYNLHSKVLRKEYKGHK